MLPNFRALKNGLARASPGSRKAREWKPLGFWSALLGVCLQSLPPGHDFARNFTLKLSLNSFGWRWPSHDFDNVKQNANFQTSKCWWETKLGGADDLGIACAESVQLWRDDWNAPGTGQAIQGTKDKEVVDIKTPGGNTFTCEVLGVLLPRQREKRVDTLSSYQKGHAPPVLTFSMHVGSRPHVWLHVCQCTECTQNLITLL